MELRKQLGNLQRRMEAAISGRLTEAGARLSALKNARVLQSPLNYYQDKRLLLDYQQKQLTMAGERRIAEARGRFVHLAAALDAMSPLKVLARGYAIVQRQDGAVLKSCDAAARGDSVSIRLQDGTVYAAVTDVQKENQDGTTVENI